MSGPELFARPRGGRRGAALTAAVTWCCAGLLATGAATGSWNTLLAPPPSKDGGTSRQDAGDLREEVTAAARDALADGKSPSEAAAAAEEAVSRSGDRWAAVYDAAEYEEFQQALDGEYTGVGLSAKQSGDGRVEVSRVHPGGPAELAGLKGGDRLVSIDGKDIGSLPLTEVLARLRGDSARDTGTATDTGASTATGAAGRTPTPAATPATGSRVVLGLQRDGRSWTRTLRRALLDTESVTVRTEADGTTVIKATAFTKGSGARIRAAVEAAPAGKGVLLDLRGNSGGLVSEAVLAASAFLGGGLVATYDIRGTQHALTAQGGGDTRRPLVALVDSGTMSAAELLTGALQDRGRAVVVGSRTFGKGSVQMPTDLPDGSVAELTVGHYSTPAGHWVDGTGIIPDLPATDGAEQRAREVLSGLGGPS
jgi:carboxyl-terminal processing protease